VNFSKHQLQKSSESEEIDEEDDEDDKNQKPSVFKIGAPTGSKIIGQNNHAFNKVVPTSNNH
jgi:hypothetical protein